MNTLPIISIVGALLLSAAIEPALAAKVGDACTPKGGGAGHFVEARAAGLPTIKCKADAIAKTSSDAADVDECVAYPERCKISRTITKDINRPPGT